MENLKSMYCVITSPKILVNPKGRNGVTEEIVAEYGKLKYDMLNMKAEVPEECKPANGPCKVTSLQWCLQNNC